MDQLLWEMAQSRMAFKDFCRIQLCFAVSFPTILHTHTHTLSAISYSLNGLLTATLKISCCNNTVLYYPLSVKCLLYAWHCVKVYIYHLILFLFYQWGNWGPGVWNNLTQANKQLVYLWTSVCRMLSQSPFHFYLPNTPLPLPSGSLPWSLLLVQIIATLVPGAPVSGTYLCRHCIVIIDLKVTCFHQIVTSFREGIMSCPSCSQPASSLGLWTRRHNYESSHLCPWPP